jgi:hypothetical protein
MSNLSLGSRFLGPGGRACAAPRAGLGVLLAVFALGVLAPAGAMAHFTRPFLCHITGPVAHGVAVDGSDHLWVSELPEGRKEGELAHNTLYEFAPAYSECGKAVGAPLRIESPDLAEYLAFDYARGGDLYVSGGGGVLGTDQGYVEVYSPAGAFLERWKDIFAGPGIAVDNSTDPLDAGAGSVYVHHEQDPSVGGDDAEHGVGKFEETGVPSNFAASGAGATRCDDDVHGNQVLCPSSPSATGLAVDSEGDIFIGSNQEGTIDEFNPDGVLTRTFSGAETPGIGENHTENGGFGGPVNGLAVDSVSGHLLVSVEGEATDDLGEGAVDEFDIASGRFVAQVIATSPGAHLVAPAQMSVDSHGDLYVADEEYVSGESSGRPEVDVFGPGRFLPTLTVAEAADRGPVGAVLSGTVNPEGLSLSGCSFQFVTESVFEHEGFANPESSECEPASGSIPADFNAHPVRAALTGLVSGTTYRYRLVASSSGALGGSEASAPLAFTAPGAPRVVPGSVVAGDLSSEFADLHARISPAGASTTYQFQYVAQSGYQPGAGNPYQAGSTAPSGGEGSIGAGGPTGSAVSSVEAPVGGLAPATTYDFRVLARSEVAGETVTTYGENVVFTTLAGVVPGLPDGRAWELVTPAHKNGAGDLFGEPLEDGREFSNSGDGGTVGFASASGDGFLLETSAAFGAFPATGLNAYVLKRDPAKGEWVSTPLASPLLGTQSIEEPLVFNPELTEVGFNDIVGSQVGAGGSRLTSLLGSPGGPYVNLHADPAVEEQVYGTRIVGASSDLGHVILESRDHALCAGAEKQDAGSDVLCEWNGGYETVNGQQQPALKLVNVNSGGSLLGRCGASLGQGGHGLGQAHDAVSAEGGVVIFTAPDPEAKEKGPGCWIGKVGEGTQVNPPELYVRIGSETVEVSAPEKGVEDPTGMRPALFVGASEDGSRIFFITETELTKETVQLGLHDDELYEYDTDTRALTRISAGMPGTPGATTGAGVQTVPAVSANGEAVYFTASGQLTANAPVPGEEGVAGAEYGEVNLYRYDASRSKISYIATINDNDYPYDFLLWGGAGSGGAAPPVYAGDVGLSPAADWYTTPDGRYLLFATGRELTGYATSGPCYLPHASGDFNGHCDEVYRYDALAAEHGEPSIVCVSCDPSGALPVSNALFARSADDSQSAGPVRAMSDDGSYVFFDTADPLVPQDGNGTLDVYEWHEGRVSLISSGKDPAPSYFLGASADGSNVFFGTHARLVPQDTDSSGDVYDARICTSAEPCIKPPASATAACEGDACVNPSPAPVDATPASLTFAGAGDLAAPSPVPAIKTKTLTKAQELVAALKACRQKPKKTRTVCEAQVRKKYGVAKKNAKKASDKRRAR